MESRHGETRSAGAKVNVLRKPHKGTIVQVKGGAPGGVLTCAPRHLHLGQVWVRCKCREGVVPFVTLRACVCVDIVPRAERSEWDAISCGHKAGGMVICPLVLT